MRSEWVKLAGIGLVAGILGGLFGIGGGIVMVPLLVLMLGFEQHRAHVTSLGAGAILALAGSVTYALDASVDPAIGALLAAGAIVGAPIGARVMARTSEARLQEAFGVVLVLVSIVLVVK